ALMANLSHYGSDALTEVKRIENEAKTLCSSPPARAICFYKRGLEFESGTMYCSSPRWLTRQYEVLFRWRLDLSEHDTWHWRVSVRGTVAVSPRYEERTRCIGRILLLVGVSTEGCAVVSVRGQGVKLMDP
ncbi:hypothetical protein Tco_1096158, partial [Tanacetum coccineum]